MKPLHAALTPDERWKIFMHNDPRIGWRPVTFPDHYADFRLLDLPAVGVRVVERLYERAQDCLLYSWLEYELSLLAEAQAFASLDLALKLRIDDPKVVNLSKRMKFAVEAGWISSPEPPPSWADEEWQDTHQLLLHLRNDIIHGSAQVHDFSMAATVFERLRAMICEVHGVAPPPGRFVTLVRPPTLNGQPLPP